MTLLNIVIWVGDDSVSPIQYRQFSIADSVLADSVFGLFGHNFLLDQYCRNYYI